MDAHEAYAQVLAEIKKHISGKEETIELLFISLVANGHALLEGAPGVAKTTMSKALADTIQADFKRVQGLPDLTSKDIIGYTYIDSDNSVKFKKGPIFTNILLVDELNRSPPKTMAALLETLEERQVTVDGVDMPLPKPFMTLATQNPLRVEGTEQIPKVLADRFLMKIDVDYLEIEDEKRMLRIKESETMTTVNKVVSIEDVIKMQDDATKVTMSDDVVDYIAKIVAATRSEIHVTMGASPRADIAFMRTGKAKALIEGRNEVTRADIKFLANPVLGHRISVRSTGGIGVHGIINGILAGLG